MVPDLGHCGIDVTPAHVFDILCADLPQRIIDPSERSSDIPEPIGSRGSRESVCDLARLEECLRATRFA